MESIAYVKELNGPDFAVMIYLDMFCFKHPWNVALDPHFREVYEYHVNPLQEIFNHLWMNCSWPLVLKSVAYN